VVTPESSAGCGARRNLTPDAIWEKIKAAFKHSVSMLLARVVALLGLLLAAGQSLLQDPNVSGAIQSALQPQYIPYYVIAIGLMTEIARRRTAPLGRALRCLPPCSACSAICWADRSPRPRSTPIAPS
jgi:hypothetical protein